MVVVRFRQMFRLTYSKKANIMIEYAVLTAVILAAFLGMSVYLKRAISGRWREAADTFGYGRQYQYDTVTGLNP